MPLYQKDGIWYWSPDNNPLTVTNPAALYSSTGSPISGLPGSLTSNSPPTGDVVLPRSITFTLAGKPDATVNVVEDGGNLDFNVTTTGKADLSGLFFDFTNSKLSTLSVSGGTQITQFAAKAGGVGLLANGVNLQGRDVSKFDVGMEFGTAGIGANHGNIQSERFVLSDSAHDLSINDLHPTGETGTVGIRDLSAGQKLEAVAPYAPTATPGAVTTPEDTPYTIPVSSLATDLNSGAKLTISAIGTGVKGPQYGTITIAPDGQSLIYTPTTLDDEVNGILTGNHDAFQVGVSDNFGGEVTSFVTVGATPVADTPIVNVRVLSPEAGDPINEVRLGMTAQSGDYATINQDSDFIQSIGLNLTGDVTNGTTITDSKHLLSGNTINALGHNTVPGLFTDEVDLLMPADTTLNDSLAVTATAAETESPATTATSAAINKPIAIDTAQSSQDLTFQTSGQSIWDTGSATTFDFKKFLGLDKTFHTGLSLGTVPTISGGSFHLGSLTASAHVKVGIEADLKITSGDVSATLPFHVNLDSTYNETTDTLQIVATDAQLGSGRFTAHGPNGTFAAGLIAGFTGSVKGTLAETTLFNTRVHFGSLTSPVKNLSGVPVGFSVKKSATLSTGGVDSAQVHIPNVGTMMFAFPVVNTTGFNPSPGTISGTGTSNNMVSFTGDLLDLIAGLTTGSFNDDFYDKDGNQFADLLDLAMTTGLHLVQKFDLNSSGLTPVLLVDGTPEPISLDGTPLTIPNASSLGSTPFVINLGLVPQATLTNNTSIGANMNVSITALQATIGSLGHIGPAFQGNTSVNLGTFPPIYSKSNFSLTGFAQKTVTQTV
jgi:hypothetical protein